MVARGERTQAGRSASCARRGPAGPAWGPGRPAFALGGAPGAGRLRGEPEPGEQAPPREACRGRVRAAAWAWRGRPFFLGGGRAGERPQRLGGSRAARRPRRGGPTAAAPTATRAGPPADAVEGIGARSGALKLFAQLLGCSRAGGAVVRAEAAEPSGAGASGSGARSGREEPPPAEQGEGEEGEEEEEEEEEEAAREPRTPGSWTAEPAHFADRAPPALQAPARASAPGGAEGDSGPPRSQSRSRRGSAPRAGPGRASETMNFLLSWVHWSLALLLYLHHAKWSQAAPMTEEGEQKPHEVVKFMDVYQRSYCRPIETLVDIFQEYPDEIEYIFKPSCVPLMRCGGCCNDEGLECVPTEEFNITMQIMRIKPHQSQHIGEMSFLQHSKCECRPKKDRARQEKKSVRGKGKGQKRKRKKSRYKSWSVPCGPCSERRKHLFVQDPQTCKCSCKNTDSRCKARQLELNERTCRCDKPRR
ncbi:vascular endothelial growth factor A [Suncus etruscus]|uniref:vascular endothelial growth factor A n=1 Tax=Suncus etruscus TaxID=109475 RepID=UPI002110A267|nr:vascular endothelial growth factor A [Suncus etruscus]